MTSTMFKKIGDIFQCELKLENEEKFIIPMREDGYIHATILCKASGKKFNDYNRLHNTKEYIKEVIAETGIPVSAMIEVYKGGNNKYDQGSWVHPDLGIHLAQWCSPSFALQVSKWVRELIITGKVEQGNEKSVDEIKEEYEKKINEMNEAHEKEIQEKNKLIMTQGEYNLLLSRKYDKVFFNHQTFLRKKELYRLKKGGCVYLIIMNDEKLDKETKVGMSRDITDRISGYRTANPFCKVLFVLYTDDCVLLETVIKRKFEAKLYPNNREFISETTTSELIESIKSIADVMNLAYTIEDEKELEKFNSHNVKIIGTPVNNNEDEEDEEDQDDKKESEIILTKRCGGITHTTEESRNVPFTKFFKNSDNKDGVNRICKDCYLVGVYGKTTRAKKIVTIPDFDETTHKWCNRCENVRQRTDFFKAKETKDGLCANCKVCKNEQKKANREQKKEKQ